ncbi:hypothetical protein [Bacillus sp. ISL-34]|nr:hypothetical protein [Bacillus sp. ISL-34]
MVFQMKAIQSFHIVSSANTAKATINIKKTGIKIVIKVMTKIGELYR